MSERKIRVGNEEFKVLGSMQEVMAEVELKKAWWSKGVRKCLKERRSET